MADVCSQGPMFAEMARQLRDLMKQNANAIQQSRFVTHMTRKLEEASERGAFASTFVSTYFAPTRQFSFCNAGHPPPLFLPAGATEWRVMRPQACATTSEALPGVVDPAEHQRASSKLRHGDTVLCYSGALPECRGSDGCLIGVEGLMQRVRQLDAQRPEHLATTLVRRLREEHPRNLADEDATILVCRTTRTAPSWRDNLLAPLRLLGAVTDRTRFA